MKQRTETITYRGLAITVEYFANGDCASARVAGETFVFESIEEAQQYIDCKLKLSEPGDEDTPEQRPRMSL